MQRKCVVRISDACWDDVLGVVDGGVHPHDKKQTGIRVKIIAKRWLHMARKSFRVLFLNLTSFKDWLRLGRTSFRYCAC